MNSNVDNFKEWLKDNHDHICELVARNGGNFKVTGFGCISSEPDWPVSVGLKQNQAFDMQFIAGCFNGFQFSIGDSLNAYDYFFEEHFVKWMMGRGFIHNGSRYELCKHEFEKYHDPSGASGTMISLCCEHCAGTKLEGSHYVSFMLTDGKMLKEALEKIT